MGVELLIKMRKGAIFTIRGCFGSVCSHPFIVCLLSVLMFIYKSSPFAFSLLVYVSPVVVCTAVLLGTVLFFGQPRIRVEEEASPDFVPQKAELSKDGDVEERKGESEQLTVGSSLVESKGDEICGLDEKRSVGSDLSNVEALERKKELDGGGSDADMMDNNYSSSRKRNDLESEYEKSEADSFDSEMVNVEAAAAWKKVEQQEEDEEDGLDSGSDQAESSSPDASMADMMPMLDELHPLLDEDVPQPIQMSRAGSEAQFTQCSSSSSNGSVDETDNPEEDDEDEDNAEVNKGFRSTSGITWTEEDQKNLMQVGSSEIERNKRLENVILRRNRRKNVSMVPEINLIDLETSDFQINISSISTSRKNPFDVPNDSYNNSGLPPVPGSAPSILLPRRNPFDIPYDEPSEEKQNVAGGESQEGSKTFQSREPLFRRNLGPSVFAPNKQDYKMRPYFVAERTVLDEAGYSTMQRQPSEVSSVADMESVSSVEEDAAYDAEVISEMKDAEHKNRKSEVNSDVKFQSESGAAELRHSRGSSISSLSEVPHKEPVYDSSPRLANDNISSDLSGVDQRFDENSTDEQSQGDKNLGEFEGERESSSVPIGAPQVAEDSDAEFQEACEKISTPTTGDSSSASHFYVKAMHEKNFEHLEEVQVPNTPVEPSEKARGIQNIDIPLIPEPIPKMSEEAVSHVPTMSGDVDEIKDFQLSKNDASAAEVNPVEVNKMEHEMVENSTDHKEVVMLSEEEVKPNTNDGSVEVKGGKLESSADEEFIVGEEETKIPEEAHYTSDTETDRTTKSSTSPSSFWAKRRLSTPFF